MSCKIRVLAEEKVVWPIGKRRWREKVEGRSCCTYYVVTILFLSLPSCDTQTLTFSCPLGCASTTTGNSLIFAEGGGKAVRSLWL
jgi:hypothetical protein